MLELLLSLFLGGGSVVINLLFVVFPTVGVCNFSMFVVCYFMSILVCNHLDGKERANRFA